MIEKKIARELLKRFHGMPAEPKSKEDLDMRVNALAERAGSEAHAGAVCEALITRLTFFPNVADIAQACSNTTDPASSEGRARSKECRYCGGENWRVVLGPYGTSAAYPCNHTADGDSRMGVRIPHVVESHYRQEAIRAVDSEAEWRANPKNPMNMPPPVKRKSQPSESLRRITAADFEGIIP